MRPITPNRYSLEGIDVTYGSIEHPRTNSRSKLLYPVTSQRPIVPLVILQPITRDIEVL